MTSALLVLAVWTCCPAVAVEFSRPKYTVAKPNVLLWADTCNVGVLSDGDMAQLIDLGVAGCSCM